MGIILDLLGKLILGIVMPVLNQVLWYPIQMCLKIVDNLENAMTWLGGDLMEIILFGKVVKSFGDIEIAQVFFNICLLAFVLWTCLIGFQMVAWYFKDLNNDDETVFSKKLRSTLKYSTFAILVVAATPLMLWLGSKGVKILSTSIMLAFGNNDSSLAGMLYNMGSPDGGISSPLPTDGSFSIPPNVGDHNLIITLFGTLFLFICITLLCVNIVKNTIEIFMVYICIPFYAMVMPIDEGSRIKQARDSVFARGVCIATTMLIFSIFMICVMAANSGVLAQIQSGAINAGLGVILTFVITIGGAVFVLGADQIISRYVGEAAGLGSAMQTLDMIGKGALMATGAGALMMFGGKKKRASRRNQRSGNSDNDNGEESNGNDGNGNSRKGSFNGYKRGGALGIAGATGRGALKTLRGAASTAAWMMVGAKATGILGKGKKAGAREQMKEGVTTVKNKSLNGVTNSVNWTKNKAKNSGIGQSIKTINSNNVQRNGASNTIAKHEKRIANLSSKVKSNQYSKPSNKQIRQGNKISKQILKSRTAIKSARGQQVNDLNSIIKNAKKRNEK